MRLLGLVLLVMAAPALAEPTKPLPEGVHATRIREGVVHRLLLVKEQGPDGKEVTRVVPDDAPTRVKEGWYFDHYGYERLLVKTAELQTELDAVKARAESRTSVVIPPPDFGAGFSAQTLLIAGLAGALLGAGVVLFISRQPTSSGPSDAAPTFGPLARIPGRPRP